MIAPLPKPTPKVKERKRLTSRLLALLRPSKARRASPDAPQVHLRLGQQVAAKSHLPADLEEKAREIGVVRLCADVSEPGVYRRAGLL